MSLMRVKPLKLNLRSAPKAVPSTMIATLLSGHLVNVVGQSTREEWVNVETEIDNVVISGFVSEKYLRTELSTQKEDLIASAISQWKRFNYGLGKETIAPYFEYIGEMWDAVNLPDLSGKNNDVPWSAAFMSYIIQNSGYSDFIGSPAHSKYISRSIVARNNAEQSADFWGYRISEQRPEIGDLVCFWRQRKTTYNEATNSSQFPSHTDLVVEVTDHRVRTIGGNVKNSVSATSYLLNTSRFLKQNGKLFAVMKNQH